MYDIFICITKNILEQKPNSLMSDTLSPIIFNILKADFFDYFRVSLLKISVYESL